MTIPVRIPQIAQGTFLVIRINGQEELFHEKPRFDKIYELLGCDCIDTVVLDREHMIVMLLDDSGVLKQKLVNPKATLLYHTRAHGSRWTIRGDVAIVNDLDFC